MGELANKPSPSPIVHPNAAGCKITKYLESLDSEDQALVKSYLKDYQSISDPALSRWFDTVADVRIDKSIVRAHRSGQCCGGRGRVRSPKPRG